MKTVATLLVMSLTLLRAEDITLTDGTVFKNAKIVAHNDKSATLTFEDGVAMVKIDKLPASALLKIVTEKQAVTPDAVVAADTNSPAATPPPEPAQIDPRVQRATDAGAITAEGSIVQVTPKGVVANLNSTFTHVVETPHHEEHTIDLVPQGLGHTPVNQTVSKDWVTSETKVDKTPIGLAFVSCPIDGLIDGQPWTGSVWRIGTYSYTEVDGLHHTVAKYTAVPHEAYVYFTAHPDQIPAPPSEQAQPTSPDGNTVVIPDESALDSAASLFINPTK